MGLTCLNNHSTFFLSNRMTADVKLTEDPNELKDSHHCYFIFMVDLIQSNARAKT